jgi:hypothetical protein
MDQSQVMASNRTEEEKVIDDETASSGTVNNPALPEKGKEKEINKGESLPGWTIMRPLRKRGNKSSPATKADANGNETNDDGAKGIAENDIKVTETNDSGNSVGEVEALHDLRSDDELLGDAEQGQGRVSRENGTPADRTPQLNDGTTEESAGNSGGEYKVYKRRWFGLVQLVLLNIIVSWDASSHSALRQPLSRGCLLTLP